VKFKVSSSETLLTGLLVMALASYLLSGPTNQKQASQLQSHSGFAYLDGVLHFPNQISKYVGDDAEAKIGRDFAAVKGVLYLKDGEGIEVGSNKVSVFNNCAILGRTLFLESGLTTKLRPDDSKQLSHCEAL
jgi:hypothetical protein